MTDKVTKNKPKHRKTNRLQQEYQKYTPQGKRVIRLKILQRCDWSEPSFHRKLNNPRTISPVEREAIAHVFGRNVYTLFPKTKGQAAA